MIETSLVRVGMYSLIKLYLYHQAISEDSPSEDRTVPVGSVSSFSNRNRNQGRSEKYGEVSVSPRYFVLCALRSKYGSVQSNTQVQRTSKMTSYTGAIADESIQLVWSCRCTCFHSVIDSNSQVHTCTFVLVLHLHFIELSPIGRSPRRVRLDDVSRVSIENRHERTQSRGTQLYKLA